VIKYEKNIKICFENIKTYFVCLPDNLDIIDSGFQF